MLTRSLIVAAFCAAMALPAAAAAQEIAYAARGGNTNVRAGPSTGYPVIARLYPGTQVDVLGCLETRAWCEVLVEDLRGWVYARRLEFVYSGRRYLVPDYYSYFDAPIVVFRFGDDHRDRRHRRYRDRDHGDGERVLRRQRTPGGGCPDYPPGYTGPGCPENYVVPDRGSPIFEGGQTSPVLPEGGGQTIYPEGNGETQFRQATPGGGCPDYPPGYEGAPC